MNYNNIIVKKVMIVKSSLFLYKLHLMSLYFDKKVKILLSGGEKETLPHM